MGGMVIKTGSRQIVHKMPVDAGTLDKVAEALGFSKAQRDLFISDTESIHIYRGNRPTPAAVASARRGGRRRQQE